MIDGLSVLFYFSLIAGAISVLLSVPMSAVFPLVALASQALILYRDKILSTKQDEFKDRLDSLESEVSAIKLQQGIKTLK